jgi:D-alanyl-D-alanine dipeptidase
LYRILSRLVLLSILCTHLFADDSFPTLDAPLPVEEAALPLSPVHPGSSLMRDADLASIRRYLMFAGCKVAPLSEIEDPDALLFEQNAEIAPANLDGLTPDAAQALDTLKELVDSTGGTLQLKSAYRPTAYQAHLHEVWVKWMKELRNNRSAGCRALREEVGAEFARHQLLVRQQPVSDSDHALGLAFDAAVAMPRAARLNGKRVTVDKLAALAGIKRPNSRRDPVHFKFFPERTPAMCFVQAPTRPPSYLPGT